MRSRLILLVLPSDNSISLVFSGTGASAIYPLLACSLEPRWQFVATGTWFSFTRIYSRSLIFDVCSFVELDPESYTYACANVQKNNLEGRVRVVRVGDDEPRKTHGERGGTTEGYPAASDTIDLDQSRDENAGEGSCTTGDGDAFEDDDTPTRSPPFGFDRLFQLHASGSGEDAVDRRGQQEENTPRDTSEGRVPRPRIEFTMCNPPFYGSAAEVDESFASKEAGPLGVSVLLIT